MTLAASVLLMLCTAASLPVIIIVSHCHSQKHNAMTPDASQKSWGRGKNREVKGRGQNLVTQFPQFDVSVPEIEKLLKIVAF